MIYKSDRVVFSALVSIEACKENGSLIATPEIFTSTFFGSLPVMYSVERKDLNSVFLIFLLTSADLLIASSAVILVPQAERVIVSNAAAIIKRYFFND